MEQHSVPTPSTIHKPRVVVGKKPVGTATGAASAPAAKPVQGRLFQHPVLELLTRSSPALIWGMYVPILGFALYWALVRQQIAPLTVLGLFLAGAFIWTAAEYLLHRYVFHWVGESEAAKRFHYIAHGYHHDYPRDHDHLFMPPLPSIILSASFMGLFWLPLQGLVLPFWVGFVLGYLSYASMHYAMHTVPNPPKLLRPLWRHHQLHHHKTPDAAFGVSSAMWDYVFRTMPAQVKTKPGRQDS